jgi:hypothetical protein
VSPDKKSWHLGVTFKIGTQEALQSDADFNSVKAGWGGGFDGNDTKPCKIGDVGIACYDFR